ncbi:MAG: hypothetical protein KatS3mg052_0305 [Candidatus Roseilinea sp.]|nr:MAG: hypothetical protein KatS3mg052_0305 [Candidatus Roseilinea sp.]
MYRRTKLLVGLSAAVAVVMSACAMPAQPPAQPPAAQAPAAPAAPETKDVRILVSMKGPGGGNPFWAAVEKGAVEKGKELGVEVIVLAPPAESDVQAQIAQVEDQLAKGVNAIAIAPTDPAALRPVLEKAQAQGVKVLFIDTKGDLPGATFIGTNNELGAKLGVDYLCKNLEKGSKVAILQGIITQSTGKARADGAKAGLTECGMNIVAELSAEWDRAKATSVMEDILTKNPDLQGLFASNDNMALGAVEALKNAGVNDKVVVVGFDANPDAAAAILAGEMEATVAQNPYNMGALGVENALKLVRGESIPENIDTGTELVTKENAANYAPAGAAPAVEAKDVRILVSMKGPGGGNPFWAAVEKGAVEKGKELGVEVIVLAPPAESDVQAQIAQVEDQLAKGVNAIAIAPTDPAALRPVLEKAQAQGVKVLFIDTKGDLPGATFIGTNNELGAKLGVDYLCKNLEKGSKVAILQGIITQSTGKARADGAKAGLTECGMNIVAELSAEWDRAKATSVMEDILTRNPDLQGLFASNDNMALGAVEALKNAGVNDKVVVVGFDANPDAAAAILAGEMEATVAQNPYNMGALGVENALKLVRGESIPENIDTGTELVTKENADRYK